MRGLTTPTRTVSFEDALRNLASRLTGVAPAKLPRTQEAVVQFMAENVPTLDEMAEAVTQEVLARMHKATEEPDDPATGSESPQDGTEDPDVSQDPPEAKDAAEGVQGATEAPQKPKRTRNTTKTTE